MINLPLECKVLKELVRNFFGSQITCKECNPQIHPSYRIRRSEYEPKGCLIAHTALSLIEALNVRDYYQRSIEKLLKEVKCNLNPWNLALATILLHDFGKLHDRYRLGEVAPQHNVVSSIITARTLSGECGKIASYAIFLHHEAFHWKDVEKYIGLISIHHTIKPKVYFLFNENILNIFNENLSSILDIIGLEELKNIVNRAINVMKKISGKHIQVRYEISQIKPNYRNLPIALALYKLIYMTDNRAASARSEYWINIAKKINWLNYREAPFDAFKKFTERRYIITLSEIPEHLIHYLNMGEFHGKHSTTNN